MLKCRPSPRLAPVTRAVHDEMSMRSSWGFQSWRVGRMAMSARFVGKLAGSVLDYTLSQTWWWNADG